ncbi:type II toxin-antitoxin system VapC family toxin [Pseudonocardia nigra]|uniref:type II toxin-antitoxin system VapC family toxin n=1 Tax=Pseudonocardia nigra TaxID=1921578 RepID=UPI001FE9BEF2|nr:PIN domain-containing protein [Pseudonocardia nigra]
MSDERGRRDMVVVDAGPLYAYVDAADAHHVRCATFLADHPGTLVVPQLVIAEVAHLVGRRLGTRAELLFLADLASGAFSTEPVHAADWPRITQLVARYRDFPLGTVDASVVACAERLGVTAVATLDHRHFGAVRPAHAGAFVLLP